MEHVEHKGGLDLMVWQDEAHENPFLAWDGEPDIVGWHRRYDFTTIKEHGRMTPDDFLQHAKENRYIVLPLYMYDHSGLSFSTASFVGRAQHAEWDSGQYGFIYWTPEKIDAVQGAGYSKRLTEKKRAFLVQQLENAAGLLNDYVQGNVFGFSVETQEGETLDSCGGFWGEAETALTAGRTALEYQIKEREKTRVTRLKTLIRQGAPLDLRRAILA